MKAILIALFVVLFAVAAYTASIEDVLIDQVASELISEILADAARSSSGGSRSSSSGSSSSSSSSSRSSPSRSSSSSRSSGRSAPSRSSRTSNRSTPTRSTSTRKTTPTRNTNTRRTAPKANRPAPKAARPAKVASSKPKSAVRPKPRPTKPAKSAAPKPAVRPKPRPTKPASAKPAVRPKPRPTTKPPKTPKLPMPEVQGYPGTKIDHKFIAKQEAYKLDMYVPKKKDGTVIGKSGATIVNGLDLGQRTHLNDLKAQGLSNELAAKLTPYLGLKKQDAANFVKAHPLSLTPAEGQQLAQAVTRTYDKLAMDSFNRGKPVTKFSELPAAAQTVIASVNHQYGSLGGKATKAFYDAAKQNDWKGAAQALRNMGASEYTARRNDEANLLAGLAK